MVQYSGETQASQDKPTLSRSGNHVVHATAVVQRAEKEAGLCEAAIDNLSIEVGKMEQALERAQQKASAGALSTPCSAGQNRQPLTQCVSLPCKPALPAGNCTLSCTPDKALCSRLVTFPAGTCFGACFGPPEMPLSHPAVQRCMQTKEMIDSLTLRMRGLRILAENLKKIIAAMAVEASGQRNWRSFFPDTRCVDGSDDPVSPGIRACSPC